MPTQVWWRLANDGSGNPGPTMWVGANEQFTGEWAVVNTIPPNTNYQVSIVGPNGPWINRKTLPNVLATPNPARAPMVTKTYGNRDVPVPEDHYYERQKEFLDPITHPHIMGITIRTVKSGRYTDPTTWNLGRIPRTGDVVAVSSGHILIGDKNDNVILKDLLVEFGGTFRLANDTSTKWRLDTFMSMGLLIMDDRSDNKHEWIFHIQETPGNTTRGGMMVMGPSRIHGQKKESHLRIGLSPAQISLGQNVPAARAGATSIYIPGAQAANWKAGQYIMIEGTVGPQYTDNDPQYTGPASYFNPYIQGSTRTIRADSFITSSQIEQRILTRVEGDWCYFAEPLLYDHVGVRDTLPQGQVKTIAPIVGNPSHNIEFRGASFEEDGSLDPTADLNNLQKRPHVMFMHPDTDRRYASFKNVARTSTDPTLWNPDSTQNNRTLLNTSGGVSIQNPINVKGRYGNHDHGCGGHYTGSDRVNCIGVSVWAPIDAPPIPGWAFTDHMTYLNREDCFAFNFRGAGFVSELGNEKGQWVNNLAMWGRGDGEDNEWAGRHETQTNHNGAAGVGFENQSRAVLMRGNIAVACRYAFLYHAQKTNHLSRNHRDIDLRYREGIVKGSNNVSQGGYDEGIGHNMAQIPPFYNNESHSCGSGLQVIHRLSNHNWGLDKLPMLVENFHCINTNIAVNIPQYSNNYYFKDCLFHRTSFGGDGVILGNVSFGWNFANIRFINFETLFQDSGAGLNYDGWFVDISWTPSNARFTNAPTYSRTGLTSSNAWNVMGDAEIIDANSGKPRRWKPYTSSATHLAFMRQFPAAPYSFGGQLPPGQSWITPGQTPRVFLGNGVDNTGINLTLQPGAGRNRNSVWFGIIDSLGIHKWPDAQSSESSLQNTSVKTPRNLGNIQPEQLIQRWGCWNDNGTWKVRSWHMTADRYTHVKVVWHVDWTLADGFSPEFLDAHNHGQEPTQPEDIFYEKMEIVGPQKPIMPIQRELKFFTRTRLEAVGGQPLTHELLVNHANVRFTIEGGANASLFRISNRQLQWAGGGNGANSTTPRTVVIRATDEWGNYVDATHTVVVIPSSTRVFATISDDFNRANEPLETGGNWQLIRGAAASAGVTNNRLGVLLSSSSNPAVYFRGSVGSSDMEVTCSFSNFNASNYVIFRAVDADNWLGFNRNDSGNYFGLYSCINGTITTLARFVITNLTKITVKDRRFQLMYDGAGTQTQEKQVRFPTASNWRYLTPLENDAQSEPGVFLLPETINGNPLPMGTNVGIYVGGARSDWIDNFSATKI